MIKCEKCGAPLTGVMSYLSRVLGVKPSGENPNICNKCIGRGEVASTQPAPPVAPPIPSVPPVSSPGKPPEQPAQPLQTEDSDALKQEKDVVQPMPTGPEGTGQSGVDQDTAKEEIEEELK